MKTFRISLIFLTILIFTACSSNNLPTDILPTDISNANTGNTESDLPTDSSDLDSQSKTVNITKLDISNFEGVIPTDLQEMLVYGEISMGDQQIIYLSDVSEFGMDDDEINDYGLWHDSIKRLFGGFKEQSTDSIKGILTSPFGPTNYFNTMMEYNQFDDEGYLIGFDLGSFESGGPYEFSIDIPEIKVNDIFNVYLNTLIVSNWEPNERIRIITYSHEAPLSPTGNFNSESFLNANSNGELWIEIDVSKSNSMWENNLIAILMYGESGKTAEFFTEKDYSSIEEKAIVSSDN